MVSLTRPVLELIFAASLGAASCTTVEDATAPPVSGFAASADRLPIAYQSRGSGMPALVLIHGWSCDAGYWDAQLEPLSRDFQVVTLDLGGHGRSGMDRSAWTIDSFGQDVAAVVEALGPGQVVLVGHSMGGDVAVAAARLLGDRVRGVVWVDTYRSFGPPRSAADVEKAVAPFAADFAPTVAPFVRGMFGPDADPRLVDRVAADMASAPPAVAIPALRSSLTYGRTIRDTIKGVKAPIVAINPEGPPAEAQSLREEGIRVVTMPGVGHFVMMEKPAAFDAVLKEAVAESLATR